MKLTWIMIFLLLSLNAFAGSISCDGANVDIEYTPTEKPPMGWELVTLSVSHGKNRVSRKYEYVNFDVACLKNPLGKPYVVYQAYCGGSACKDFDNWGIIDPRDTKVLIEPDDGNHKLAEKAFGGRLVPFSALEEEQERFVGAWFAIEYPPNFSVRPGLKSLTAAEGVDTVWFTSPDGSVEFYVCSPQWGREPTDFTPDSVKEELVSEKHEGTEASDKETWWFTWKSKDGSYFKSIVIKRAYSSKWAIGLKYRDQEAYKRYKNDYLRFKGSLVQYAD